MINGLTSASSRCTNADSYWCAAAASYADSAFQAAVGVRVRLWAGTFNSPDVRGDQARAARDDFASASGCRGRLPSPPPPPSLDSSETPAFAEDQRRRNASVLYERVYRRGNAVAPRRLLRRRRRRRSAFSSRVLPGHAVRELQHVENPDCLSAFFAWSSTCSVRRHLLVPVERDGGGRPADGDLMKTGEELSQYDCVPETAGRLKPFEANPTTSDRRLLPRRRSVRGRSRRASPARASPTPTATRALAVQFDEVRPEPRVV